MQRSLIIYSFLFVLSACGGVSQPPNQLQSISVSSAAVLGPISAGNVNIYRLSNGAKLNTETIKTTELTFSMFSDANNKLYKNAKVGAFSATLNIPQDMANESLVKIVVTGGKDIDANDDFIIDSMQFIDLKGELVAITTLEQLKTGKVVVNALSVLAANTLEHLTTDTEIKARLTDIAQKLLSTESFAGDINGDKKVDFMDLALFNPKLQDEDERHHHHLKNAQLYQSLLPSADEQSSFIDSILSGDDATSKKFSENLLAGYLYRDILISIIEDINGNKDGVLTSVSKLNAIAGVSEAVNGRHGNYWLEFIRSVTINNPDTPDKSEIDAINTAIANINIWLQNSPYFVSSNTFRIAEHTTFVGNLSATDADPNDVVSFTIIDGDDKALFDLSAQGLLTFKTAMDFENPVDADFDNHYQLHIAVNDLSGSQTIQSFSIEVVNQLEEAEVFAKINSGEPLSLEHYAAIGLDVSVTHLDDMNTLVSSKNQDDVSSTEKLQILLDFVHLPIVSITSSHVNEGQGLVFSISLDSEAIAPALSCMSNNTGSAIANVDFVYNSIQLSSFPNNFSIQTLTDTLYEGNETVGIRCQQAQGLRFSNVLVSEMSFSGLILGDEITAVVPENIVIQSSVKHAITSVLDIQGMIDGSIDMSFFYTLTGSATASLSAYSVQVQLSDSSLSAQGESGVNLTLAWAAQILSASGSFAATISVDDSLAIGEGANDGAYQLKRLNPSENPNGIVLATFAYPLDVANNMGTVTISIAPGILDRNFGDGEHNFLYLPVQSTQTGRVWLNNNLGANYANRQHANFNPLQQALNYDDSDAYGSKFQWGRLADGHEIDGSDWLSENNADIELWQGVNATGAVCPEKFRVPTFAEFLAEFGSEKNDDLIDANNGALKLTTTGYRDSSGNLSGSGKGYYWTVDTLDDISMATIFYLSDTNTNKFNRPKANGYTVRCIKDF